MKIFLQIFILTAFLAGCKNKDSDPIIECTSGCTDIMTIKNRVDYYLPFSIVNNCDSINKIILNKNELHLPLGSSYPIYETGFYEMVRIYNNSSVKNDSILFTTKNEEREFSEWGIKTWVPAQFETTILENEDIDAIYPRFYADNIKIPFIFYITIEGNRSPVYLNARFNYADTTFYIKQGVGSSNISASQLTDNPAFNIGGKSVSYSVTKKTTPDIVLSGDITEDLTIAANSFVRITGNLRILNGASLTIKEGTMILVDEGIDINHSGTITFNGTNTNPVFITCSHENKYWGGFLTTAANADIEATYTIFCQSGYHESGQYNWGHAQRQALFFTENSNLTLDHCYMLDHIGQVFYPQYSVLNLKNILVQRVKTSGQINTSDLTIKNSIFTDFPDDSRIFQDNDNDALYISASDATIDNSVFMFAKDDGIDSGNDDGGIITVRNTLFEACFHEGAALSSRNLVVKNHTFINCTFTNCGQGLEMGFSSPNHTAIADHCIFYRNGIGVRYGDNYNWSYIDGKMLIKNSFCIENDMDVWNMVRMNWSPKIGNMTFENTFVSKLCPQYPAIPLIQN